MKLQIYDVYHDGKPIKEVRGDYLLVKDVVALLELLAAEGSCEHRELGHGCYECEAPTIAKKALNHINEQLEQGYAIEKQFLQGAAKV
jgi:hypothetical protein